MDAHQRPETAPNPAASADVSRIAVVGPAGRVLEMRGLANVRAVIDDDGHTLRVLFDHKEHQ